MSKFTPGERAAPPSKDFGLPEKAKNEPGNYPVPDRGP